jgi:hypothetical protein
VKQSPELSIAQTNMRPGVITLHGFLGPDDRNLIDILTEDDGEVNRLGFSHEQIALRMEELRDQGKRGLGEFIKVEPHFQVRVETVRGKLPSPFGGAGLHRKTNTIVRNDAVDREITYTDLQIHLISNNGFYQGKGSTYRLRPADIVDILEIQPTGA